LWNNVSSADIVSSGSIIFESSKSDKKMRLNSRSLALTSEINRHRQSKLTSRNALPQVALYGHYLHLETKMATPRECFKAKNIHAMVRNLVDFKNLI
jgi:hypothetical protein